MFSVCAAPSHLWARFASMSDDSEDRPAESMSDDTLEKSGGGDEIHEAGALDVETEGEATANDTR